LNACISISRRRCFYCDFPIQVVGDGYKENRFDVYTNSIITEIQLSTHPPLSSQSPLETVYFGGGTPSLLPIQNIRDILSSIHNCLGMTDDCEITIEIDPGTFDDIKLAEWLSIGVNRFSLGIQSFDDHILEKCGRAHRVIDIHRALSILHNSPVEINFSIDLISGLPHLTTDIWEETLKIAVNSKASHVSIYDLQIEDKTAFGRWFKDSGAGQYPLPDEDTTVNMYQMASKILREAGFEHYEISNYARPHKRSRHNQLVSMAEYLLEYQQSEHLALFYDYSTGTDSLHGDLVYQQHRIPLVFGTVGLPGWMHTKPG
jgi:putative oxygen-independent coproporphyrinogen III oxidase